MSSNDKKRDLIISTDFFGEFNEGILWQKRYFFAILGNGFAVAVLNEKRGVTYTGKISTHYNMLENITDFIKIKTNDEQHKGLDVHTGILDTGPLYFIHGLIINNFRI